MKKRHLKTLGLIAAILLAVVLAHPTRVTIAAGLIFVIIGETVRFWAAGHLIRKQELATSGPYAYVRDPLYFGRLFLLTGFCIMGGPWCMILLVAGLGVFFWSYLPRKYKKEMTWLEDLFGEDYTRYAAASAQPHSPPDTLPAFSRQALELSAFLAREPRAVFSADRTGDFRGHAVEIRIAYQGNPLTGC